MKRILMLLMIILCLTGCDKKDEESSDLKPVYVSTITDDMKEGTYLVLDKQENNDGYISFVLQDEKQNRYYIKYDANYIAHHSDEPDRYILKAFPRSNEEPDTNILKIIPGDTVIFSEDTYLISLEDTKWKL